MLGFTIIFTIIFFIYGIITKNSKGITVFYSTYNFYNSDYFIRSKFISHIINFIYSLIIIFLLYFKKISDAFAITIPLIYFLGIYLVVKIYEFKIGNNE